MAPLYKVTLERKIDETFYVSAETDDFARGIAMDVLFGDPLGYFRMVRVEEGEVDEDDLIGDE